MTTMPYSITKIYIDTSIVGGFFDNEFATETIALFERLKNREVIFVLSDVLKKELLNAPPNVRDLLQQYDAQCFQHVELTHEAEILANCYLAEKVVGATNLDDCQHIAIATINKVDVLASWNFKHIVNLHRIKGYNSVNMKMGYITLEIRNPKELIYYGND
jgi:predicted nucleic acid-binding protein